MCIRDRVCPTGIDIRKGLQYECIGCAACIDVCDGVMDKMQYPRGLIRYDTQHGMQQHLSRGQVWQRVFRPRVLVYTGVLVLICGALLASLALRSPFRVDVVRDRGALARLVEDGWIENVYRLQIMNATEQVQRYRVGAAGLPGVQTDQRGTIELAPAEARWVPVAVRVPPEEAERAGSGAHAVDFVVERLQADGTGDRRVTEKSTFIVPR